LNIGGAVKVDSSNVVSRRVLLDQAGKWILGYKKHGSNEGYMGLFQDTLKLYTDTTDSSTFKKD
ncbi:hypothetical protein Gohar_007393, partial [Gossypium harknessii]|nr:hypothetical protein [Gossypium harknessii]